MLGNCPETLVNFSPLFSQIQPARQQLTSGQFIGYGGRFILQSPIFIIWILSDSGTALSHSHGRRAHKVHGFGLATGLCSPFFVQNFVAKDQGTNPKCPTI